MKTVITNITVKALNQHACTNAWWFILYCANGIFPLVLPLSTPHTKNKL